eukprot:jgi/Ulvmu1/614/UM001_0622.1
MYESGQARPTRTQTRSHEKTASGIPQPSNRQSSLSASGALMSTHRAIIQASYRTLRPSAEPRNPAAAAPGKVLQSTTFVPKKSPSLCMPGHPSRDIPGSYHLPYYGQYGSRAMATTLLANQSGGGPHMLPSQKLAAPASTLLQKPMAELNSLTANPRQGILRKAPARRMSASGGQRMSASGGQPAWPTARVEHRKPALPLPPKPSSSLGDCAVPSQCASARAGDTLDSKPSTTHTNAPPPCPPPAAHDSCAPSDRIAAPTIQEKLRLARATYCVSARSRHLQQYLESASVPTAPRAPTGGRDRAIHVETDTAKDAATHSERLQALGRHQGGPQLRSAYTDLLPVEPLAASVPADRLGSTSATAGSLQRRPSTVPNMRSRLTACASGLDVPRPGTSAGVPYAAAAAWGIGPWCVDSPLGCPSVAARGGPDSGDADKGRDQAAATQQADSLGAQYAGWTWGPGSASCLPGARNDANRPPDRSAVHAGARGQRSASMEPPLGKEQNHAETAVEEDPNMLTCESVAVNAVLMSQLTKVADKKV